MNLLKNLAVTLIGFGFVALGILLLFKAETESDRVMAVVCTLFFAAVAAVGMMDFVPKGGVLKGADGRVVISASRWRAGIYAFGGLAFFVAGAFMGLAVVRSGFSLGMLIGALGVPFGLAVMVYAGRLMLSAGTLYVLDAAGIESRSGIRWRLAWDDIDTIAVGQSGSTSWLMLETLPHVPDPPGALVRLNRRFGMPPYAISAGASGVDFGALTDAVIEMWQSQAKAPTSP